MIFNFPGQTSQMIAHDIECVKAAVPTRPRSIRSWCRRPAGASIEKTVGHVDYKNEAAFYHQIYDGFCGGEDPEFRPSSCYTFSREEGQMIDEYVVNYEEYPGGGQRRYQLPAGRLIHQHL